MTPQRFVVISIVLLLMLLSCRSIGLFAPTLTLAPTPTLPSVPTTSPTSSSTSTPTLTLTPTPSLTSSNTPTLTPSLTAIEPTVPAAYQTINVNEYGSYTVYWKRVLWENALNADVLTEDFELDEADYGKLSFPFLTGHGFILDGGECSGQILREANLLPSGNILHFRSWGSGLRFVFPDETDVSAFGFDYQPSEDWRLIINNIIIDIPEGRKGFIGIVFFGNGPSKFSLTSLKNVQGGLSVDNISYVKSTLP